MCLLCESQMTDSVLNHFDIVNKTLLLCSIQEYKTIKESIIIMIIYILPS